MNLNEARAHWNATAIRQMPDGSVCCVQRQLFTYGLLCGITALTYQRRYCFEHREDAEESLKKWNGTGDPPGMWIKEKPSERLGPGAFR